MLFIKKTLLLLMAASVQASPLAEISTSSISEPEETTLPVGNWPPPPFPEGAIDISNNRTLINEIKRKGRIKDAPKETSADGDVTVMSRACSQGTCPDYDKRFDAMYTWSQQMTPDGMTTLSASTTVANAMTIIAVGLDPILLLIQLC